MADVCIKVNQVFSQCQQKDCPVVTTTLTSLANIAGVTFQKGSIVAGAVTLTPIPGKVDYFQAQFTVSVPYLIAITGLPAVPGTITAKSDRSHVVL